MKKHSAFFLVATAVLITLSLQNYVIAPRATSNVPTPAQKESAFEHVMQTKELRCGFITWPPLFVIDPTTKAVSGLAHDLVQATADKLGLKVTWTEILSGQQLEMLKSRRIDMTCNDGPFDMTLGFYTAYTRPLIFARSDFYTRSDETRFDDKPELINDPSTHFVVMDGDFSVEVARSEYPKAQTYALPQNADPSQMMLDVVTKKADVLFTDPLSMNVFLKHNPGKLRRIPMSGEPHIYPLNFGVLPEEKEMLRLLNMGIDLAFYAGAADQILDRYDPDRTLFLRPAKPYLMQN